MGPLSGLSKCFGSLWTILLPLRSSTSWGIPSNFQEFLAIYTLKNMTFFKTLMPSLWIFMQITPSRIETLAPLWMTSYRRSPSVSWPSSELRRRSWKCFSGWSSERLELFFPLAEKGSWVERNSSLTPVSTAHSFRSCCGLFLSFFFPSGSWLPAETLGWNWN